MLVGRKPFRLDARLPRTRSAPSPCVGRAPSLPLLRFQFNRRAGGCLRMARGVPIWAAEDGPMTNSYARDGFTYGFDFARPRSRAERIARLDALATLLDTAFILPGTNVRFGFDALIGLLPGIGDAITTAISLYIVHEARQLGRLCTSSCACSPMSR